MADEPLTDERVANIEAQLRGLVALDLGSDSPPFLLEAASTLLIEVHRLRTENAAMRPIVAAVAEGKSVTSQKTAMGWELTCVFCGYYGYAEKSIAGKSVDVHAVEHAPDCPAVLAARVMEGMKE